MELELNLTISAYAPVLFPRANYTSSPVKVRVVVGPYPKIEDTYGDRTFTVC